MLQKNKEILRFISSQLAQHILLLMIGQIIMVKRTIFLESNLWNSNSKAGTYINAQASIKQDANLIQNSSILQDMYPII